MFGNFIYPVFRRNYLSSLSLPVIPLNTKRLDLLCVIRERGRKREQASERQREREGEGEWVGVVGGGGGGE